MNIFSWINQFISRLPNFIALNLKEKSMRYDFFPKSMQWNLKNPRKNSGRQPLHEAFKSWRLRVKRHKGPVKKAYVNLDCNSLNPLSILFFYSPVISRHTVKNYKLLVHTTYMTASQTDTKLQSSSLLYMLTYEREILAQKHVHEQPYTKNNA